MASIRRVAAVLEEDLLHLVVFGPGYGEGIAVGAPEKKWLLVDSLGRPNLDPTFVPAIELLEGASARAAALVLTHPHDDHVVGIDRIVARYLEGDLGAVESHLGPPAAPAASASRVNRASGRRKALTAMGGYWRTHPDRVWRLRADGSTRSFGQLNVSVLHPDDDFVATYEPDPEQRPNPMSAPLLVDWRGVRLVLGADLPATEWAAVLARSPSLSAHEALKVPHHGSRRALDDDLLVETFGPATRIWIVAPWHKGGGTLPNASDGEGLARLLLFNSPIYLTSAGCKLVASPDRPITRSGFNDLRETVTVPSGKRLHVKHDADPDESWIVISLDPHGVVSNLRAGAEVVEVVE